MNDTCEVISRMCSRKLSKVSHRAHSSSSHKPAVQNDWIKLFARFEDTRNVDEAMKKQGDDFMGSVLGMSCLGIAGCVPASFSSEV